MTANYFSSKYIINSISSNSYKAISKLIINTLPHNKQIYQIKESLASPQNEESVQETEDNSMFMLNQKRPVLIQFEKQIYAKINTFIDELQDTTAKTPKKFIETVELTLFSYITSLNDIKLWVDDETDIYLQNIDEYRNNKRFVYTLLKPMKTDDSEMVNDWQENLFQTSKTFSNIFFEHKQHVIEKIDFFINNRQWYEEFGIPYTLGIGLYGPPGTGKTSFIKALAKYTDRHIVSLSMKIIKTRFDLEQFFFESTYNENNKKGSVGFDKKIIVIEDIDCAGNIVLERNNQSGSTLIGDDMVEITSMNQDQIMPMITNQIETMKIMKQLSDNVKMDFTKDDLLEKEKITLDDILNLFDGIRENTGRILIITSNFYNRLDSALTRPGRIDITLSMSNASHKTIREMFIYFYKQDIPTDTLAQIKPDFYSPAELINLYVKYNKNPDGFLARLHENKKIA
jgi:ATP-dependent 26S proteasome regulatory subunit